MFDGGNVLTKAIVEAAKREPRTKWTIYLVQLILASIMCSMGFITDSGTTIIGSMLVSPVGGLIISIVQKIILKKEGVKKNTGTWIGLILATIFFPIVIGALSEFLSNAKAEPLKVVEAGKELQGRANSNTSLFFLSALVIAIVCGSMFGIIDTGGMVGIGIATALLPPLVAQGMYITKILQIHTGLKLSTKPTSSTKTPKRTTTTKNTTTNNETFQNLIPSTPFEKKKYFTPEELKRLEIGKQNIRENAWKPIVLFFINFVFIFIFCLVAMSIARFAFRNDDDFLRDIEAEGHSLRRVPTDELQKLDRPLEIELINLKQKKK